MSRGVMIPLHFSAPFEMREQIVEMANSSRRSIGSIARELIEEGLKAKGLA